MKYVEAKLIASGFGGELWSSEQTKKERFDHWKVILRSPDVERVVVITRESIREYVSMTAFLQSPGSPAVSIALPHPLGLD